MFQEFAAESVGRRINLLFRLSMMHIRGEMKKMGVGPGDYVILPILFLQDGLSQDELSKQMRVDKSNIARAVAKMEKMGMVERKPDPHEHRIKRVYLCQKALEMQTSFFNVLKEWHHILVKDIDPWELDVIKRGMDRMMKNAEDSLGLEELDNIFNRKII